MRSEELGIKTKSSEQVNVNKLRKRKNKNHGGHGVTRRKNKNWIKNNGVLRARPISRDNLVKGTY